MCTVRDPRSSISVAATCPFFFSQPRKANPYLFPAYETGAPTLLLQLSGTLSVPFRGATYQFPLTIWIPQSYPRDAPLVYVSPTKGMNMRVRPGQHVSGEGRVYHWYLARWDARGSTIVEFLGMLRDVFAREPPVISIQEQQQQQQQQQVRPLVEAPPAVPPLPVELRAQRGPATPPTPPVQPQQQGQVPPPLPPKPGERPQDSPRQPVVEERHPKPPPLPPVPGQYKSPRQSIYQDHQQQGLMPPQQTPPHQRHFSGDMRGAVSHPSSSLAAPATGAYARDMRSPASAVTQQPVYQPQPQPGLSYVQAAPHGYMPPTIHHPQPQHVHPGYVTAVPPQQPVPVAHVPFQPPPLKKPATPDLLTSPFDLALPEPTPSGPPPPIPPNPEKDAVLHSLSRAITQTLQSNVARANSAISPLHAQSNALNAAMATLQSEASSLNNLQTTLQSNISILQHSLHQADTVIAGAKARLDDLSSSSNPSNKPPTGLPPIDDVLVAPTVVGKQLYDLVADERGIQRALYALQVGLVTGRVRMDAWAKHTRGLAREAFLKKALIRKAGLGMGLSVDGAF